MAARFQSKTTAHSMGLEQVTSVIMSGVCRIKLGSLLSVTHEGSKEPLRQ